MSSLALLGEEVAGLSDTGLEEIVVLEDELNVVNWKVDKHTSDLGCLRSDHLSDKFVEDSSDLVLVVRVVGDDGWEDVGAGHDELLVNGECLLWDSLLLDLLVHLLHLLHLLLGGWLLLHHWSWASHAAHWCALVHHAWSLSSLSLLLVLVSVVVSSLSLVRSSWATWSSVLVVWSLAHGSLWLLLLHEHWHALDEKLEVVLELFLVSKVGPLGGLGVLLAELLEATLVLGGLVLQLADLLDLVVVDGEGLVLHNGEKCYGAFPWRRRPHLAS